jgi:hypothetical protein
LNNPSGMPLDHTIRVGAVISVTFSVKVRFGSDGAK